jgi:hypothetical protein
MNQERAKRKRIQVKSKLQTIICALGKFSFGFLCLQICQLSNMVQVVLHTLNLQRQYRNQTAQHASTEHSNATLNSKLDPFDGTIVDFCW